jgi:predicted flavoprotein YhiN
MKVERVQGMGRMLMYLWEGRGASSRCEDVLLAMGGMGWDGMGWDGMGWDGMGQDVDVHEVVGGVLDGDVEEELHARAAHRDVPVGWDEMGWR